MAEKIIVELNRFGGDAKCTIGSFIIDGHHECFSLEDEYRAVKLSKETRIPEGSYELQLVVTPKWSKILGHPVIMLIGVPNFSSILIHPLNTEDQTEGCLGPGETLGYDHQKATYRMVNSRIAYSKLYVKLAERIRDVRKNGDTPKIKIQSITWNPYDQDGNPHDVAPPPVASGNG